MKNSLLVLSILILTSSCAPVMTGKTQEVTFDSEPQGAEVAVNGRVIGKTPTTIQLDKKKDQTVSFKLEGYKTQTRTLETKLNAWFIGNIVLGGFIGSSTDGITGVHKLSSSGNVIFSLDGMSGAPQNCVPHRFGAPNDIAVSSSHISGSPV